MNPLARNNDPGTSNEAAEAIQPHLAGLHAWALDCIVKTPGKTRRELGAIYCTTDPDKIGRRLHELDRQGRVRRGAKRKCTVSGHSAETWWPVAVQEDLFGGAYRGRRDDPSR